MPRPFTSIYSPGFSINIRFSSVPGFSLMPRSFSALDYSHYKSLFFPVSRFLHMSRLLLSVPGYFQNPDLASAPICIIFITQTRFTKPNSFQNVPLPLYPGTAFSMPWFLYNTQVPEDLLSAQIFSLFPTPKLFFFFF